MARRITAREARARADAATFGHVGSDALEPLEGILGQERAVEALAFGLEVKAEGFNIFVVGQPGTGRTTAVQTFLERIARTRPTPPDVCYVHHFRDPSSPTALFLPAGRGRELKRLMEEFVETLERELPRAFEHEAYQAERQRVIERFEAERRELMQALTREAEGQGFYVEMIPQGVFLVPVRDGRPLRDEEFARLPEEEQRAIRARRQALEARVGQAMREFRHIERRAQEALKDLDRRHAATVLDVWLAPVAEAFQAHPEVLRYLEAAKADVLDNLALFLGGKNAPGAGGRSGVRDDPRRRYAVNVLVDRSGEVGAPVVVERHPTFPNLIGRIEREALFGALVTDFTLLRAGSLLRANGGFLIVPVPEVLRAPFAWDGLKRALRAMRLVIEDVGDAYGALITRALRPEPIPLDLKVILIGDPVSYYLLYHYDPDVRELFKVKAEFATTMPRTPEGERRYGSFFRTLAEKEGLLHLEASAMAKLVEYGARLAEDQEKLSTRFAEIADVVREADHYARKEGAGYIADRHVVAALEARRRRAELLKERMLELYAGGVLLVDVAGTAIGQVNALAVVQAGEMAFGLVKRVTASVAAGREGIVDIEREARLGGRIHTKGVLILSGYLRGQYAREAPFPLAAHLVFEQSYEGVEGDSASLAELLSLLSAIGEVPLRQDLAVTGAVNQKGTVQAIGGVNEKIEGFFDVCREKGLTGTQGVVIPAANVRHLMLREDVVQAIEEGRFHLYAVETVDEALELFTGLPAGVRGPDGAYPPESVHGRVAARLRAFQEQLQGHFVPGSARGGNGAPEGSPPAPPEPGPRP
ncbi:ATP-binding protein [Hydrogenibacillus schlegelii]|uniref:endopeptidase La n=1 Tax=Hydrogenibacillus schlegelii TaxID=1484 RepID=A0A179IQF5_HYDSH|nr:ATP-binding protein [Hydrogenibacillus schlegelii]MBT9282826.1 AAA family ATPase [Hydrogenibacillus schlegelii]OAR03694.1 ATP-dependent protease [Hydrogenibacillus schlegelii]PTQ54158.1 MAG: ATP-dependent protease La [Hydrogenibacillus schlegelii]